MQVDNFITEGTCLIKDSSTIERIDKLKEIIKKFMHVQNYLCQDIENSNSLKFILRTISREEEMSLNSRKRFLGKKNLQDARSKKHMQNIRLLRDDLPYIIRIFFSIEKKDVIVKIISEPMVLQKIRQLSISPPTDAFKISDIVSNNKIHIEEIFSIIGGKIIENPKTRLMKLKDKTIKRLNILGLKEISKLLIEGKEKIENGNFTDGLSDLRSSWEKFIKKIIIKTGRSPVNKVKKNLQMLKDNGRITTNSYDVAYITQHIYSYLSDKPVHNRIGTNITDAKFLFSLIEISMDFILDKVILKK